MKLRLSLSVAITVLCLCSSLPGQDFWVFDGSTSNPGDWNDPLNWDLDSLPTGGNVFIGDPLVLPDPVVNINGTLTEPGIGDLRVGLETGSGGIGGVNGTLNQNAGTLSTTGWSFVGGDGPASDPNVGTYNLSGTAVFNNNPFDDTEFHIGIGGGENAGNQGFVTVSDSATMNLERAYVGSNDGNFGTLTQTGGQVVVGDWLAIGRQGGATGTYNMSGGSLTVGDAIDDYLTVGESALASGTMTVSGDATIQTSNLAVARFGSFFAPGEATGLLTITGGDASISTTGNLQIGINEMTGFSPTDAFGTLRFESTGNVSPISVAGDVWLNDGTVIGSSNLEVDLTSSSVTGNVTLISVGGTVNGTFAGLPEGASVPNSGSRTITYMGGDGNDIVLLAAGGGVSGDFDDNDLYECADVDALVAAIVAVKQGGQPDLAYDLTGDSNVTNADLDAWLAEAGAGVNAPALTASGNPVLPGDATLDGTVDGQDFIEWNTNKFQNMAAWCAGDFNADGLVDGQDFIVWNGNKFMTADAVSVPEPSTLWLGLLCVTGLTSARRRRTHRSAW